MFNVDKTLSQTTGQQVEITSQQYMIFKDRETFYQLNVFTVTEIVYSFWETCTVL